jgi:protein-tyrosine phosphatase
MMAKPRAGEWLQQEIKGLKRLKIDCLVSLLEPPEASELELSQESQFCVENQIEFLNFPIPDRGVPLSIEATDVLVKALISKLNRGLGVAIHCRAGIGRTGIIAGCVLSKLGKPFSDIFPILSEARRVPVPDTSEQIDWVKTYVARTGTEP